MNQISERRIWRYPSIREEINMLSIPRLPLKSDLALGLAQNESLPDSEKGRACTGIYHKEFEPKKKISERLAKL